MSSTTDRRSEAGQVLVLFVGGLVALFLVAALAFDVGSMLLERRTEQNVADAAALAGARYVTTASTYASTCVGQSGTTPQGAACDVARANNPGLAAADIKVNIPPVNGQYRGVPAVVQVRINTNKSSIFGGVIGKLTWPVGVNAVAANQKGVSYPFGMLALDPTACKAIQIAGTGAVNSAANVQSNSDGSAGTCGGVGFARNGSGTLTVTADSATCRSVSVIIQDTGAGGPMGCTPAANSFALPDPLRNLPAPPRPDVTAPAMKEWTAGPTLVQSPTSVPDYCPGAAGSKAPSITSPRLCVLGNGPGQKNREWVLFPGLYPGGLDLGGGVVVRLTPGIYWIGGGGIRMANDVAVMSVDNEGDRDKAVCPAVKPYWPCVGGGGVLIYNSSLPGSPAGPVTLGGGGATLSVMPYHYPFGATFIDIVYFQDRTVALGGDDLTINGSSGQASEVRGIVYLPQGDVKVNGSDSVFSMDQIIALTFYISGSGGTVNVLKETGVDAKIEAVGLVE